MNELDLTPLQEHSGSWVIIDTHSPYGGGLQRYVGAIDKATPSLVFLVASVTMGDHPSQPADFKRKMRAVPADVIRGVHFFVPEGQGDHSEDLTRATAMREIKEAEEAYKRCGRVMRRHSVERVCSLFSSQGMPPGFAGGIAMPDDPGGMFQGDGEPEDMSDDDKRKQCEAILDTITINGMDEQMLLEVLQERLTMDAAEDALSGDTPTTDD